PSPGRGCCRPRRARRPMRWSRSWPSWATRSGRLRGQARNKKRAPRNTRNTRKTEAARSAGERTVIRRQRKARTCRKSCVRGDVVQPGTSLGEVDGQASLEEDGEVVEGLLPALDGHRPLLGRLADGQVDQLHGAVGRGILLAVAGELADHPIDRLD